MTDLENAKITRCDVCELTIHLVCPGSNQSKKIIALEKQLTESQKGEAIWHENYQESVKRCKDLEEEVERLKEALEIISESACRNCSSFYRASKALGVTEGTQKGEKE